ncbi:MAG: ElyC/SanA/YdcF family protein [Spirosomataceae bacterium]
MKTALLHIKAFRHSRSLRIALMKQLIKAGVWSVFSVLVLVLLCNWVVVEDTQDKVFFDLSSLPSNDVGLVLGTNKYVARGKENLFFRYRMEASALLFKEGKVKYLILSGNKEAETYDEPKAMKNALAKLGVPEDAMLLDTAGYRTYDSVVRCREIYGQEKVTVISQNFHNARALYLAEHEGLDAVGFAAQDVADGYSIKTLLREYLARPKAILDVYVLKPEAGVREGE